jgi:membrane fusion protein, heavy metal efflux system
MKRPVSQTRHRWIWPLAALLTIAVGWLTADAWLPTVRGWLAAAPSGSGEAPAEADHDDHEHAGHEHDNPDSLHLSEQARKNIGLRVGPVEVGRYERAITVPALVVEQPARTRIEIAAPMTGVVVEVGVRRGETVRSDDVLFRLRLTHEDLIESQTEFLRTMAQLDVAEREIARLGRIAREGIAAGEVVLEREYERDKLTAALDAARESLRLHGLSEAQVAEIERSRRLIREVTITAPRLHPDHSIHDDAEASYQPLQTVADTNRAVARDGGVQEQPAAATLGEQEHSTHHAASDDHSREADFVVQELPVHRGEAVQAGTPLCVLADMQRLYVEGRGFEQDAPLLATAARQGWAVTALLESPSRQPEFLEGLDIVYLSNEIDPESRALYFYVALENEPVRDVTTEDGRRYVTWRFKPGQRLQLRVPVEIWPDVIALPLDAVAQEGPEFYVFTENGDHFDRRPVHVVFRDSLNAVIENDGSIFPGEKVALNSAHQLQMALKNKAGGGVDPHAGHHH